MSTNLSAVWAQIVCKGYLSAGAKSPLAKKELKNSLYQDINAIKSAGNKNQHFWGIFQGRRKKNTGLDKKKISLNL